MVAVKAHQAEAFLKPPGPRVGAVLFYGSDAGLVSVRREHRHRYYTARREVLGPVGAALQQMWDDALWRLKLHAELEQTRRGPKPRRRRRRTQP